MSNKYPLTLIALAMILVSCVNTRKATYFNDQKDADIQYKIESLEPVLQKNDLLNITVTSVNADAAKVFNPLNTMANQGNVVSGSITQTPGYLIDQDGNIQFPMLGTIKAAGLTKKQLKEHIANTILQKNLLYDPMVTVRYLNYKVTVLGEVANPSVINVPNEKITLLEAIGLAGDLTLFAKRDEVMLIQDTEGKRIIRHLNLNSSDLFTSPYYYLQSNDVVYIPPNKSRVASTTRTNQWLPILISSLSLLTIVVDRYTR